MKAIFAIDGGNATGLAWGIFDDKARSVEEAFQTRLHDGSATINHKVKRDRKWHYVNTHTGVIEPAPYSDMMQVHAIYTMFLIFKRFAVRDCCMNAEDVELVIEDFILLPGPHAGGKDGVASVRIAWGLAGFQEGVAAEYGRRHRSLHISEPIWQPPSAQGKYSDDHLRRWGIWIPGRDHERSALKHIAFRLNKLLK